MARSRTRIVLLAGLVVVVTGMLFVAALIGFGVPYRADYRYVELNSPEVTVRERDKPPLSFYRGDEIPLSYEASIGDETIFLARPSGPRFRFVPALEISVGQSEEISVEMLVPECSHQSRQSEREIVVFWETCALDGSSVGFTVRLASNGTTLPVNGVVRTGGRFTGWEKL